MEPKRIISSTRAAMMNGKRLSPPQIASYENAIRQTVNDGLTEVMMLYFAESLHDVAGYGIKRTGRILRTVDEHMKEWLDPAFDIDALRVRVFEKTHFMFALSPEEQERIEKLLKDAGYNVSVQNGEVNTDGNNQIK